jgi:ubiquinone/menaquinone biosynthesis C-methylase UbiE
MSTIEPRVKPFKGIAMEGAIASWYAKTTGNNRRAFADLADRLATMLSPGAVVLEIAPGPGYLSIELARRNAWEMTGLDISRSFVRMATENAERAGVRVRFRHGDAAAQPFAANSFDFIVCRAAFKNFGHPIGALTEMHRVLRAGGTALILDMRGDADDDAIDDEVGRMQLGRISGLLTSVILKSLRRRAYSREALEQMIAATPFGHGEISAGGIGFEMRLTKAARG